MKNFILILALSLLSAAAFATPPQEQAIFDAMQDEMHRTITMLKKDKLEKPYFAAYKVTDTTVYSFSAAMGSLTKTAMASSTLADVFLRVGSPEEDNSYFSTYLISTVEGQMPGEGYSSLRAGLWSATDDAYKTALAQLARKQAYKKNKNMTEDFPDFSKAEPYTYLEQITPKNIDKAYWEDIARQTSAQGKPGIDEFTTSISITLRPTFYLSSENAKYLKDIYYITIQFTAKGKTKDGFEINENKQLNYMDFKEVPTEKELVAQAAEFAQSTLDIIKAPKAEPFIGPVMLEGYAATVLFNNAFKNNIVRTKKVLSATSEKDYSMGEFAQKMGLKIMPAGFDVIDDPTLKTFKGKKLGGTYIIDDEGVKASKLQFVKNGKLTTLPTTRSLIKGQKTSNGHAVISGDFFLFPQAGIGNLFFFPHETIPAKEMKAQLIKTCAEEGLEYCYIIRGNPARETFSAYKVNTKTGEETPVNGITSQGFSTRTLRDIKYSADDLEVYNIPGRREMYSIVSPSVILSEMEFIPTQKAPVRQPLVARP